MLTFEELPELNSERWLSLKDFDGEIWKDVEDNDTLMISNYGRFKRKEMSITIHYKRGDRIQVWPPRIMKTRNVFNKLYNGFQDERTSKVYLTHKAVALAFLDNPYNYPCIDHIDTNKSNNMVNNLRWCDMLGNMNNETTLNTLRTISKEYADNTEYVHYPNIARELSKLAETASPNDNIDDYDIGSPRYLVNVLFDKEIWKPLNGFETKYEISNLGRVRITPEIYKSVSILKPVMKHNYYCVKLYCDLYNTGKKKIYYKQIHTLVANTFLDNPNNYPVVNHKDCNKINNKVNNLEWCTYSYNNSYFPNGKVNDELKYYDDVIYLYNLDGVYIKEYLCVKDCATELNCSLNEIRHCCFNRDILNDMQFRWASYVNSKENIDCYHKNIYVNKYDKNGNFIAQYENLKDAWQSLNIFNIENRTMMYQIQCIRYVCDEKHTGKTYKGYIWKWSYSKDNIENLDKHFIKNSKTKSVNQYDLDGNFIKTWYSADEAAKELHINHNTIRKICNRINTHCGLYQWRWCDDCDDVCEIDESIDSKIMKNYYLNKYDLSGKFIIQMNSYDIEKELNIPLKNILRRKNRSVITDTFIYIVVSNRKDRNDIDINLYL